MFIIREYLIRLLGKPTSEWTGGSYREAYTHYNAVWVERIIANQP